MQHNSGLSCNRAIVRCDKMMIRAIFSHCSIRHSHGLEMIWRYQQLVGDTSRVIMTGLGPTTGRKLLKYHYSGLLQQTAHHDDGSCSPASSLCSQTNNLWKLISLDMSRSRPVPVVRSALRAFGLQIQKRKMHLRLLEWSKVSVLII